jgi:tetratricopeptide (TPR) repeat protein
VLGRGVFVGREDERSVLIAGLVDAIQGQGRVFLVGGEPGIGKTRLAEEVAARAGDHGLRVLWGRCWEEGGAPAFWPWAQCIRALVREGAAGPDLDALGPSGEHILRIVPGLRDPAPPEVASADPGTDRFLLFDAAASFFRVVGWRDPLLLILDDLHAADEPSLLLLRFMAEAIGDARVVVLGTFRDSALTPDHPLSAALPELARRGRVDRVTLAGLSREEVARYIEATTSVSPSPGLVAAIHERSEGNPLFVSEIVRLLASEGTLDQATLPPGRVPPGVRETIRRRLGHLSERALAVLEVSSVLGREFPLDALERATGLSTDDLLEVLDEAIVARLVAPAPSGLGRLRFSHALVQETLYEAIVPARRLRLHERLGEILERLHADALEPHLSEIARHFIQAAPGGQVERAVTYARQAGEHAARLLAWEEALRLYEAALEALELIERPDEATRCRLLMAVGDVLTRAGDFPRAKRVFLDAVELARRIGSPELLAAAALGYGGRFVWMRAGDDVVLAPLLREALARLGEEDTELRVRLLARLSGALRDEVDRGPRDAASKEAVRAARHLGDPATLAYALVARYTAIWGPDNAEELLSLATEVTELATALGDRDRLLEGTLLRHKAFMQLGDLRAARVELAAAERLTRELKQPPQAWYVAADRAALALLEARLDEAEPLIERAREVGQRAQPMEARTTYAIQMWALRRDQGRLEGVVTSVREAAIEFPWYPHFRCCLAVTYAELGQADRGRVLVEELAGEGFATIPVDNEWLFAMAFLGEAVGEVGDEATAEQLYRLLEPYSGLHAYSAPELSLGSVSRPLGLLAARRGHLDDARAHLEAAIEENRRMDALPWLVRSMRDLAMLLRDSGETDRAGELVAEALDIAEASGLAALEHQLGELRTRIEDTQATPATGRHVLRREGEYWSVGFDGRSLRLRDSKGLRYLARLLAAPGQEIHALDLVAGEGRGGAAPSRDDDLVAGRERGEDLLDRQAVESYRHRLAELEQEIEEARSWGDPERAARAEEERDALVRELATAMGIGGRSRKAVTASERARVSVTRALKAALARIAEHHPELDEHLRRTVRTGTYCSYLPDPRVPADWDVRT